MYSDKPSPKEMLTFPEPELVALEWQLLPPQDDWPGAELFPAGGLEELEWASSTPKRASIATANATVISILLVIFLGKVKDES